MRGSIRQVAFVGKVEAAVCEELRFHGFRLEQISAESIVTVARDLVHLRPTLVHARESHLKVGLVAHLLNLPFVVQAARRDVNALTARAARMAERTLCGGASIREGLVSLGAPVSSTVVVRGLLQDDDLAGTAVFQPILEPQTKWVVAAAPCDGPDRGHADLLLAFASVARTRPWARLLVAGRGPAAPGLSAQIDQSGLRGRAVVAPLTLDHLPGVFARAAAVVGPSRSATLPDPITEALALGAPVIATAVGQHATWVREGRTGWLVPPRSPAALAARLAQVLDDPGVAHRVAHAGMSDALEHRQPHNVALSLTRCWSGIARPPPSPFAGIYLRPDAARAVHA